MSRGVLLPAHHTSNTLRELFEHTLREAMQLEFDQHVGAERYERNGERLDHRNGTRRRRLDTRMGTIDLDIPRLRGGAYVPSFLEHRTRSERAVIALVQEAVISGVSTRKVAKLVAELGITSLSKSQVSNCCVDLDEQARAFRERSLTVNYPSNCPRASPLLAPPLVWVGLTMIVPSSSRSNR